VVIFYPFSYPFAVLLSAICVRLRLNSKPADITVNVPGTQVTTFMHICPSQPPKLKVTGSTPVGHIDKPLVASPRNIAKSSENPGLSASRVDPIETRGSACVLSSMHTVLLLLSPFKRSIPFVALCDAGGFQVAIENLVQSSRNSEAERIGDRRRRRGSDFSSAFGTPLNGLEERRPMLGSVHQLAKAIIAARWQFRGACIVISPAPQLAALSSEVTRV
jgi:hypothetical protein